jgi:hypothetical protein
MSFFIHLHEVYGNRFSSAITDSTIIQGPKERTRDQLLILEENVANSEAVNHFMYYRGIKFAWTAGPGETPTCFSIGKLSCYKPEICENIPIEHFPELIPLFEKVKTFTFGYFGQNPSVPLPLNFSKNGVTCENSTTMAAFLFKMAVIIPPHLLE